MEQLLEEQSFDIDKLVQQISNYGKDGKSRKTKGYLDARLLTMDEYWNAINNRHTKLEPFGIDDPGKMQPYFVERTFDKTKASYQIVRTDIIKRLAALGHEPEATNLMESESSDEDEHTEVILDDTIEEITAPTAESSKSQSVLPQNVAQANREQTPVKNANNADDQQLPQSSNGNVSQPTQKVSGNNATNLTQNNKAAISTTNNNAKQQTELMMRYDELMDLIISSENLRNDASHGRIKMQIEILNASWTDLRQIVYRERLEGGNIGFNYNFVLEKYLQVTGRLNDFSKKVNVVEPNSNAQFSLPKLNLPQFSGKASEWIRFISLFNRMVHQNKQIDNGLKIEYLKSVISGDAAKMINHIEPTPENYVICYELLCKRYQNKREILGKLLDNILQLPKLNHENSDQLKSLHDTVYESIMTIKNLGFSVDNWDPLLTHILTHKLDSSTIINYECQLKNVRETQSLKAFLSYIENRFMALQSAKDKNNNFVKNTNSNSNSNLSSNSNKNSTDKQSKCILCEKGHYLQNCADFEKKQVQSRIDYAKSKKLCMNCLSTQHKTSDCKSQYKCKVCKKTHHTLLHLESKQIVKSANVAQVANIAAEGDHRSISAIAMTVQSDSSVLLATALVGVFGKNGNLIVLRALLDQGSQCAFISENAAQTLGLTRESITAEIAGIGATVQTAKWAINLTIVPRFESSFHVHTYAVILPKLTRTAKNDFNISEFAFLPNLTLADPSFMQASEIDIILGAAEYAQIIKNGLLKANNSMIAQNTEFGWVISGSTQNTAQSNINVITLTSNIQLERQLTFG